MGIVDYLDAGLEYGLVQAIFQEARAARHGGAGDGAREVADKAARDAWIIDHRHRARGRLLRIEPADGAFARALANVFWTVEVFLEAGGRPIVIPLHAGVGAGQDRDAEGEA